MKTHHHLLTILVAFVFVTVGCKAQAPTADVEEPPKPERRLVKESLDINEPGQHGDTATPLTDPGALKPSLLAPVGGLPFPERSRLIRVHDERPVYEVEATLKQLRRFYVYQGFAPSSIGAGKGLVIIKDSTRLHIHPGKGRVATLRFFLKGQSEAMPDTAIPTPPEDRQRRWKVQSDRVKEAMESGDRNLGKILGPDFPD
jgi:hypothetical protein